MRLANESAQQQGSRYITRMHLLVGLASAPGSASASLVECGVDLEELQRRALQSQNSDEVGTVDIITDAIREVERLDHAQLDAGHVLLAMIAKGDDDIAALLESMGVALDELRAEVTRRLPQPTFPRQRALAKFAADARVSALRGQLDDAQQQLDSALVQADYETADSCRDKQAELTRALDDMLQQLWNDSPG